MKNPIIIEYYRICKIKTEKIIHPINYIELDVFTKKQLDLVMRDSGDALVPRESTIGGGEEEEDNDITQYLYF